MKPYLQGEVDSTDLTATEVARTPILPPITGTQLYLYRYLEHADAGSAYSRDGQAWEGIQFRAEPAFCVAIQSLPEGTPAR